MTDQINDQENLITEATQEEVYNVLEFVRNYDPTFLPGIITPMLLNQRMKDITLNSVQATESTLEAALKAPKDSEEQLQSFSQDFEITSQPYKRLLAYLGNMLSFDLTYSCTNIPSNKTSEYTSLAYRKDLDVVKEFLDKFDYVEEFTNVVKQLLRNEAFFCSPRFDFNGQDAPDKYTLQELPSSPRYTMLTGRWAYGWLYSLNMYWFIQPGVDIDLYSPFFKQKFLEAYDGRGGFRTYDPTLSEQLRGRSSYIYWQDLPVSEAWCWKFNPTVATRLPHFSGLFLDLIQQPVMRAIQKSINESTAARVVVGQIGLLKETSAKTKDQFNINPAVLGQFLAVIKAAIGDALKVAAVPLEDVKGIEFSSDNEIYSSYLKTALGNSGVNTNLVFSNDLKMNTIETQLSLNSDEQLMTALYPQFNNFLKYQINSRTKKYKFDFNFEGTQFYNNRQQRLDHQIELSSLGIVLPQKIAASIGMNPFDFERQLAEAKETGFVDKLTPIISGFQQSGKDGGTADGGRPQKKDTDLTESGAESRATGSNIGKGGTI